MLGEEEWIRVSWVVNVLMPFNKYSINLQSINCTLSDFFGFWTSLKLKVKNQESLLEQYLSENLSYYEADLLENPLVACAVYLDPRFQRALSAEQKETAVDISMTIHAKIEALTATPEPPLTAATELADNDATSPPTHSMS